MAKRPWYKRFPADFIAATMDMSLEEKGAYSMALDLMYDKGGRIPDDARYIARVCGCSTRRWKQIREKLIERGDLVIDGDRFLAAPILRRWQVLSGRQAIPQTVRDLVFERDDGRCTYCGSDGPFHIDHVIPHSRGGNSYPDNLVLACVPCNLSKGAKTPREWLQ